MPECEERRIYEAKLAKLFGRNFSQLCTSPEWHHNPQHKNIQQNDNQHYDTGRDIQHNINVDVI